MARRKDGDPLVAALIAKLPAPGTAWPVDRQKAWLKLMALALSATYGGDVGGEVEAPAAAAPPPQLAPAPAAVPPKPAEPNYLFFVDRQGFAKRKGGTRLMPEDVSDILYDLRGEAGDPGAVIWADDSVGDGGPNISISVVM